MDDGHHVIGSDDSAECKIASATIEEIRSTLATEANIEQRPLTEDKISQLEILLTESKHDIEDLEELKSRLTQQVECLRQEIDRESQFNKEHQELHASLSEKRKNASQPDSTTKTAVRDLVQKVKRSREYLTEVVTKVEDFTDKHFPPTDELTYSVNDIIVNLINKYLETPEDMYVTLSSEYPAHYTDMLLHYNIIETHPEDSRRIRIIPFYE